MNNSATNREQLAGWIISTFNNRDSLTMLTLFKNIVLFRPIMYPSFGHKVKFTKLTRLKEFHNFSQSL